VRAQCGGGFEFGEGFGFGVQGDAAIAAPGEIGQRLQRRFGITKTGDELSIGDRANRIGADQAQPGNSIGRNGKRSFAGVTRQAHLDFCPIFDSVPAARRERLSRCWKISSAASATRCVAQPRLPVRNQTPIGQAMAASMPPTLE
jgi:hypothetical protein